MDLLKRTKEEQEWLFLTVVHVKGLFERILAIGKFANETALRRYGDYFGFTQQVMIKELLIEISKLYVRNKSSHTFHKLIIHLQMLVTEKNCNKYQLLTKGSEVRDFSTLYEMVVELNQKMQEYEPIVDNLDEIRDKTLAHLDKKISTRVESINFQKKHPLSFRDIKKLVDFSEEIINQTNIILNNAELKIVNKSYENEINLYVSAIENANGLQC